MSKILKALVVALFAILVPVNAAQAQAKSDTQCTKLTCQRCEVICAAYCATETTGKRARAYRGCAKGCKNELCTQCMPVQSDANGRKFLPGKTELCRTPGRWADGKTD